MNDRREHEAEVDLVEAVYDALDAGEAERALELTASAVAAGGEEDPVLHFLAGVALLDLERPAEAVERLRSATRLDPDDGEFRARLGEALFRCCEFGEAEREVRGALEADPRTPLAHHVHGLLLERRGRLDEADRELERAAELDPDGFPRPVRLERREFERHVADAIESLPPLFREPLSGVAVSVEDVPPEPILRDTEPPLDPELLGLFVGIPRTEQDGFAAGELPPRIYLFRRNLERFAASPDELVEQIAVTVRHELGHYLGLDEEEIEQAGHG